MTTTGTKYLVEMVEAQEVGEGDYVWDRDRFYEIVETRRKGYMGLVAAGPAGFVHINRAFGDPLLRMVEGRM